MTTFIESLDILNTKGSVIHKLNEDEFVRLDISTLKRKDMEKILNAINVEAYTMLILDNIGLRNPAAIQNYKLSKSFNLTNWKEHFIEFPDTPYPVKYIEVKHIKPSEIIRYFTNIKHQQSCPLVVKFMSDRTLIRITPFSIDVVSEDKGLLSKLKEFSD
ncbi:hypothetical protein ACMGE7_08320 [Macrococcus equi]|uniref:hypothetical protein n=1 Tax=Macrococcus equi TaxID=3395462 RepID=UPI0039BE5C16